MALTTPEVSAIISLAALGTAVYGILERGNAAKRAERVRLTTIIENLAKIRREVVEYELSGTTAGPRVEVLLAQVELLAQQAFSLVQKHSLAITSTECREVAVSLERVWYMESAEAMWVLAEEAGRTEGEIQSLSSSRGFALFLFRNGRADEARLKFQESVDHYSPNSDIARVSVLQTLSYWRSWETATQGQETSAVVKLTHQIDELTKACTTQKGKDLAAYWARGQGSPTPNRLRQRMASLVLNRRPPRSADKRPGSAR